MSGEQIIKGRSETIDVGANRFGAQLAIHLLGRGILRCAEKLVRQGDGSGTFEAFGETEVDHLDPAEGIQEQIRGLQIAVKQRPCPGTAPPIRRTRRAFRQTVYEADRVRRLRQIFRRPARVERLTGSTERSQMDPVDQLHREPFPVPLRRPRLRNRTMPG